MLIISLVSGDRFVRVYPEGLERVVRHRGRLRGPGGRRNPTSPWRRGVLEKKIADWLHRRVLWRHHWFPHQQKKWTVVKQVIRGISFQTQRDLMRELFFWLSTCDWPVCCQATLATNVISPFAFNLLTWQHRQLIFYYIAFSSFTIAITLTSNTPLTPRFLTEPKRFSGFKDNHNFVIL